MEGHEEYSRKQLPLQSGGVCIANLYRVNEEGCRSHRVFWMQLKLTKLSIDLETFPHMVWLSPQVQLWESRNRRSTRSTVISVAVVVDKCYGDQHLPNTFEFLAIVDIADGWECANKVFFFSPRTLLFPPSSPQDSIVHSLLTTAPPCSNPVIIHTRPVYRR